MRACILPTSFPVLPGSKRLLALFHPQSPHIGCFFCLEGSAFLLANSSDQMSLFALLAQPGPCKSLLPTQASIMLTIKLLLLCLYDDWFNKCSLCQMRHTSSLSHSCVPHSRRLFSIHLCQHSPSLLQALPMSPSHCGLSSLFLKLFLAWGLGPTHYFHLRCFGTFWALSQCSKMSWNILEHSVCCFY